MNKEIITHIPENGIDIKNLAFKLNKNSGKQFTDFIKEINKLIDKGICFDNDGILFLSDNFKKGTVDIYKGNAYILDKPVNNDANILLFNGDLILYKENKHSVDFIKIIERKTTYVYGTMLFRKGKLYFFSDDKRLKDYKIINEAAFKGKLKPFYKIRCFISDYQNKTLKIDKVIGHINDINTLIQTILLENDAPLTFSNKIIKYCDSLNADIYLDKRKDLRDLDFVTIDGEDAKDYDDAIYVEESDHGYLLYVSIADVSYYVNKDDPLDKEAKNRGTSIYYPGKVIPMLPFRLSNDLCSLIEGKDRYTLTCLMDIDYKGEVINYDIFASVIKSKHRLTYTNVNKIFNHDKEIIKQYDDITNMLYKAYSLSRLIFKKRKEQGGIEFETNEPLIVEKDGKVKDIKIKKQDKAELMIENFMIMANTTVASHMFYLNLPMIYRNHDYPKVDKLLSFIKTMEELGINLKGNPYKIESKQLNKILEKYKDSDNYYLISEMLLRCMAKALYSHNCLGHYGLGLKYYCHFTSPIRRYPDLIVHRMLRKYLFNHENDNESEVDNVNNETIAKKANEKEKQAIDIERAIMDLKMCEYMLDKVKQTFIATICSITNYGFYIRLDNGIEGLVHIKTLDGFFYLDENNNLTDGLITFKIAQKVKVKLVGVDLNNRNLDFIFICHKNLKK